jgi:RNA polymerase sigma-70 factor, ECF subfamily
VRSGGETARCLHGSRHPSARMLARMVSRVDPELALSSTEAGFGRAGHSHDSSVAAAHEPADDAALMLRFRDGDRAAFAILYERYRGLLYRYLRRVGCRPETADDLFQEAWSRVIVSAERYQVRAQFKTYLFRIAHNCAIDHFRRHGRGPMQRTYDVTQLQEVLPGAPHDQPEARACELQLLADFNRALQALPVEQRETFVLFEDSGLGLEAIGKVTGVSTETAKSRLRYAVGKLRAALQAHRPLPVAAGEQS